VGLDGVERLESLEDRFPAPGDLPPLADQTAQPTHQGWGRQGKTTRGRRHEPTRHLPSIQGRHENLPVQAGRCKQGPHAVAIGVKTAVGVVRSNHRANEGTAAERAGQRVDRLLQLRIGKRSDRICAQIVPARHGRGQGPIGAASRIRARMSGQAPSRARWRCVTP